MPGFKKDFMTMPSMNGTQWMRTGGLFGRNRVGANPHAANKAPAANANPYSQPVKGNLLAPVSVTNQNQQPNQAMNSNPFAKQAIAINPMLRTLAKGRQLLRTGMNYAGKLPKLLPSTTPVEMGIGATIAGLGGYGAYQTYKNIAQAGEPQAPTTPVQPGGFYQALGINLPNVPKLANAMQPSIADQVPSLEQMHTQRLRPTTNFPQPTQPQQVGQYLPQSPLLAGKAANYGCKPGDSDPTNSQAGAYKDMIVRSKDPRTEIGGKLGSKLINKGLEQALAGKVASQQLIDQYGRVIQVGKYASSSKLVNNTLQATLAGKYSVHNGVYAGKSASGLPANVHNPNIKVANRIFTSLLQGGKNLLGRANPMRWFNRAAPAARQAAKPGMSNVLKGGLGIVGTGAAMFGPGMFANRQPTSGAEFPINTWGSQYGVDKQPGASPFVGNAATPSSEDWRTARNYNYTLQKRLNPAYPDVSAFGNVPNSHSTNTVKSSAMNVPFTPSKYVPITAGIGAGVRGLTANDNKLQEAGKGALVSGATALGANYAGHKAFWSALSRLNGANLAPNQAAKLMALKVILPTVLAAGAGGAASGLASKYSIGDFNKPNPLQDLFKHSAAKDWNQLHDVLLNPPTLTDTVQAGKQVIDSKLKRTQSIFQKALPVSLGAIGGIGMYTLGRKLLKMGAVKPAPQTTGKDVDLSDVMRTRRADSKMPPRGDSSHLFKNSSNLDELVEALYGQADLPEAKISANLGPIKEAHEVAVIREPGPNIAHSRVLSGPTHTKTSADISDALALANDPLEATESEPEVATTPAAQPVWVPPPLSPPSASKGTPGQVPNWAQAFAQGVELDRLRKEHFSPETNPYVAAAAGKLPTLPTAVPGGIGISAPNPTASVGSPPATPSPAMSIFNAASLQGQQAPKLPSGTMAAMSQITGRPNPPPQAPQTAPAALQAPQMAQKATPAPAAPKTAPTAPQPVSADLGMSSAGKRILEKLPDGTLAVDNGRGGHTYEYPSKPQAPAPAPSGAGRLYGAIQQGGDALRNPAHMQALERQKAKLQAQMGVAGNPAAQAAIQAKMRRLDNRMSDAQAGSNAYTKGLQRQQSMGAQDFLAAGHSPEAVAAWEARQKPRLQAHSDARLAWEQAGKEGPAPTLSAIAPAPSDQLAGTGVRRGNTPGFRAPQRASQMGPRPVPTINAGSAPVTGVSSRQVAQTGSSPAIANKPAGRAPTSAFAPMRAGLGHGNGPKPLPGMPNPVGLGQSGPSTKLGSHMEKEAILSFLSGAARGTAGAMGKGRGVWDAMKTGLRYGSQQSAKNPGMFANWGKGTGTASQFARNFYLPASPARSGFWATSNRLMNAPYMQPVLGGLVGSGLGESADSVAALGGYETDFGTYGGILGAASRLPGVGGALRRAGMPGLGKSYNQLGKAFTWGSDAKGPIGTFTGWGPSLRSKIQSGLTFGGMGADFVRQSAEARGADKAMQTANDLAKRFGFRDIDHFATHPMGQAIMGYNKSGLLGGLANGWNALPSQAKMQLGLGAAGLLGGGALAMGGHPMAGAGLAGLGGLGALSGMGGFGSIPGDPYSTINALDPEQRGRMSGMLNDMQFTTAPMADQSRMVDEGMKLLQQQNQLQAASG